MINLEEMRAKNWKPVPPLFVATPKNELGEEDAKYINRRLAEYFAQFVSPLIIKDADAIKGTHACIGCEAPINGATGMFSLNADGATGRCASCGYPYRILHFIKDEEGDDIFYQPINLALPYHPNFVTEDMIKVDNDGNDL